MTTESKRNSELSSGRGMWLSFVFTTSVASALRFLFLLAPFTSVSSNRLTFDSQSVLRGFQMIRELFQEDPWIHFCNGYFEFYFFFLNSMNNVLLKLIAELF
jgi:hypothetical protein